MSAIGTVNSFTSDVSSLLTNSSKPSPAATSSDAAALASDSSSDGSDAPATRVDLSDKVKAILARASNDQNVADHLKALVESRHSGNASGSSQTGASSPDTTTSTSTDVVDQNFEQLSGGTQAPDESQDDGPVTVAHNFAGGLKADGYTISAVARASDGSFQVEIMGPDGKSFLDRRFGASDEFSTFTGITAGNAAQSYQQGNKEYITFSQSNAAAVSTSASSAAGSTSASSVGAHTEATTFVVDFSTGAISMLQSESTSVSTIAQASQPGSGFSAIA
jgi:trimeric autotransporter adhesin